jgi:undecaprenyl-diphosphatase
MTAPRASAAPRAARPRYPWLLPAAALALLVFLTVDVLVRGPLTPVDERIFRSLHHLANEHGWRWLKTGPATPARLLVDLGNPYTAVPVLGAVAILVAAWRWSLRPLLTAATGLVLLLATAVPMKYLIARPEPKYGHLRVGEHLGVFPSGHTATACVCYILAVLVVAPEPRGWGRRIALGAAAALGVLVGVAMMWCSMHWFTDIVAALALAALIIWATMQVIRRVPDKPRRGKERGRGQPAAIAATTR